MLMPTPATHVPTSRNFPLWVRPSFFAGRRESWWCCHERGAAHDCLFVRVKKVGAYEYLYQVEDAREGGLHVQRVIKALGRRDEVAQAGQRCDPGFETPGKLANLG